MFKFKILKNPNVVSKYPKKVIMLKSKQWDFILKNKYNQLKIILKTLLFIYYYFQINNCYIYI